MEIKRIPIIGIIGTVIGMLFAFETSNSLLTIVAFWAIAELVGILLAPRLPKKYGYLINSSHWVKMNLIGRLFGVLAIIAGLAFLGSIWHLFPNKNYTYTFEEQIGFYVVSIFLLVIGVAFLTVKGYYPKEYNTTQRKEEETNK